MVRECETGNRAIGNVKYGPWNRECGMGVWNREHGMGNRECTIATYIQYLQVKRHYASKYSCHGLVIELIDGDDVEVAQETRRDRIAATTRGSHGSEELDINQRQLACILLVIPKPCILHPNMLDGWQSTHSITTWSQSLANYKHQL